MSFVLLPITRGEKSLQLVETYGLFGGEATFLLVKNLSFELIGRPTLVGSLAKLWID